MKIAFSSVISNVGFKLNNLSTSDVLTWAVFSAGVLIASGTWNPPAGAGESSDTDFNILEPVDGSILTYTYGSAATIEACGFDEVRLGAGSDDDYRLLSITVSEEVFPDDVLLSFDLGATDDDGDPVAAIISIEDEGAEATGFIPTGTSADEVLLGGDGDDVLIGGAGSDELTGGEGDAVFVIDMASYQDSPINHSVDDITDYLFGEDVVNLTDLSVVDPSGTDIVDEPSDFVRVVGDGPGAELQVDVNGAGDGDGSGDDGDGNDEWVTVATLDATHGVKILYSENGIDKEGDAFIIV